MPNSPFRMILAPMYPTLVLVAVVSSGLENSEPLLPNGTIIAAVSISQEIGQGCARVPNWPTSYTMVIGAYPAIRRLTD